MAYSRFVMPMASEATGYEYKGRKPAGRCLLEEQNSVGKLTLWVQDLRPQVRYGVFMIFADGDKYAGISIGPLTVDEKGKAEMRRAIEPHSLQGFTLQETAAVAVIATGAGRLDAPLCGYRGERVAWKSGFYEKTATQPVPEAPAPKPEIIPEPEAPPEPEIIPEPEPLPEPEIIPEPETPPEMEIIPEPEAPEIMDAPVPPESILTPEEKETLTELFAEKTPPAQTNSFVTDEIFKNLPPIHPFSGASNTGIQWARFTPKDNIPAPDDKPDLFNAPFIREAFEIYGHFILGIMKEDEATEYIIGIPGAFNAENQAQAEKLGFSEFKCFEDIPPEDDAFGYWLMFVG